MTHRILQFILIAGTCVGSPTFAQSSGGNSDQEEVVFVAPLDGYEEVPAISTPATGEFEAKFNPQTSTITYKLSYRNLESRAQQAHVHLGQPGVNGGIAVWLCGNAARAGTGTRPCPQSSGSITGTIQASDVIGPQAQGIAPGGLPRLFAAMDAGATYVNVHTLKRPNGEIRGQLLEKGMAERLEGRDSGDSDSAETRFVIGISYGLAGH